MGPRIFSRAVLTSSIADHGPQTMYCCLFCIPISDRTSTKCLTLLLTFLSLTEHAWPLACKQVPELPADSWIQSSFAARWTDLSPFHLELS